MTYKVTIAITIFNTESFIEKCLNSAFNQTFESIEFLLLDDCSTDGTIEKIQTILEKSHRNKDVKLIKSEVNRGIGAVRDSAFKIFRGDYLFFLDGDDELFDDSIEKLYKTAIDSNADIVVGSIKFVDALNKGREGNWFMADLITENPAKKFFKNRFYPITWNKLYRRGLIVDNDITCGSTNQEDEIISLQLFMFANKVIAVSHITYCYLYRNNSISSNFKLENFINYSKSINYMQGLRDKFIDHDYYPDYIKYVYRHKLLLFWRLSRSGFIKKENKLILQEELLTPFLSFSEIIALNIPAREKLKFLLLFFPKEMVLYVLNHFSPFFRRIDQKIEEENIWAN